MTMTALVTSLTLMALLMTEQAVGLGYSLSPLYYKQHQANHNVQAFRSENDDANRVTPSMFMARYNPIGSRALRAGDVPLYDVSSVMLPLEQRGMWRSITPPSVRTARNADALNQLRAIMAKAREIREAAAKKTAQLQSQESQSGEVGGPAKSNEIQMYNDFFKF